MLKAGRSQSVPVRARPTQDKRHAKTPGPARPERHPVWRPACQTSHPRARSPQAGQAPQPKPQA